MMRGFVHQGEYPQRTDSPVTNQLSVELRRIVNSVALRIVAIEMVDAGLGDSLVIVTFSSIGSSGIIRLRIVSLEAMLVYVSQKQNGDVVELFNKADHT
jgi:hypothetical protein